MCLSTVLSPVSQGDISNYALSLSYRVRNLHRAPSHLESQIDTVDTEMAPNKYLLNQ